MQYKSTIGADFLTKEVSIDGKIVQLQLWDTAGAEKFHSMGRSFYRGSECCLLVFDLTDAKSFESIESWRTEFLAQLEPKDPNNYPFVIIANKCDKIIERKVPIEKIKQYCEIKNIKFFEASAKDRTNVKNAFEEVAKLALNRNIKEEDIIFIPDKVELKNINQRTIQKNCC